MMGKRKKTSIWVDERIWEDFRRICKHTGVSICNALEGYMESMVELFATNPHGFKFKRGYIIIQAQPIVVHNVSRRRRCKK